MQVLHTVIFPLKTDIFILQKIYVARQKKEQKVSDRLSYFIYEIKTNNPISVKYYELGIKILCYLCGCFMVFIAVSGL